MPVPWDLSKSEWSNVYFHQVLIWLLSGFKLWIVVTFFTVMPGRKRQVVIYYLHNLEIAHIHGSEVVTFPSFSSWNSVNYIICNWLIHVDKKTTDVIKSNQMSQTDFLFEVYSYKLQGVPFYTMSREVCLTRRHIYSDENTNYSPIHSGWTVTRACSTSRRAMVECMVMDPLQKAVMDMAPEVTALAATRVPDIRTRVLIWKEIKKKEVSATASKWRPKKQRMGGVARPLGGWRLVSFWRCNCS